MFIGTNNTKYIINVITPSIALNPASDAGTSYPLPLGRLVKYPYSDINTKVSIYPINALYILDNPIKTFLFLFSLNFISPIIKTVKLYIPNAIIV